MSAGDWAVPNMIGYAVGAHVAGHPWSAVLVSALVYGLCVWAGFRMLDIAVPLVKRVRVRVWLDPEARP